MEDALYTVAATGNPMDVLFEYCHLIRKYDIADDEIAYEGHHRDSIWMVAREYPAIKPMTKYQMTKWADERGSVELLIANNKNHHSVIGFKGVQIRYLELRGRDDVEKAQQLDAMGLDEILELTFKDDIHRSGTIRNWIDGDYDPNSERVRERLQSYIVSPTVQNEIVDKNFRAVIAVIVGLRQILVREMDRYGNWVSGFQFAHSYRRPPAP